MCLNAGVKPAATWPAGDISKIQMGYSRLTTRFSSTSHLLIWTVQPPRGGECVGQWQSSFKEGPDCNRLRKVRRPHGPPEVRAFVDVKQIVPLQHVENPAFCPWRKAGVFIMCSRGAATECSPGREPGVFFRHDLSPVGAKESFSISRPLRGSVSKTTPTPGLRPGLHSVAAPRLNARVHE